MFGLILTLSQAPVIILYSLVYFADRQGKEPALFLILSFVVGMLAFLPAVYLELYTVNPEILTTPQSSLNTAIAAIFGIALVEEGCKFFGVRFFLFPRKAFNEPYDGIMYTVSVSLGIAAVENFGYVKAFGLGAAVIRMFSAVPMHAICGVLMGYYLGLAKFNPRRSLQLQIFGLIAAVIAHGIYDYLFLLQNLYFYPLLLVVFISQIALAKHAIAIHRNLPAVDDEKECLYAPDAEAGLLGNPLRWATMSLSILGIAAIITGAAALFSDVVNEFSPELTPDQVSSIATVLILFGLTSIFSAKGVSQNKRWPKKLAVSLFLLLLPTPLFIFSLLGMYGLLVSEEITAPQGR